MPASIDFTAIARAALGAAERLVPLWLPAGRREGHEWSALNPTRSDEKHGSFKVNLTTGKWSDFASGDSGGDLVALYAYLFTSGNQGTAARELARELSMTVPDKVVSIKDERKARSEWEPVMPVPADAGPPPKAHLRRGRPGRTWEYRDAAGNLIGVVYRFTTSDGGKEILPCVWARNSATGELAWRWMQWSQPRPLYGLDRLAERPNARVLVVEGEKCADAAHEALGDHFAVISWPGGGKATEKVDWSPLKGRDVVIWPDCDAQLDKAKVVILPQAEQPGTIAAEHIAAQLGKLGCNVRIVVIPEAGAVANGWDVADAIEAGQTPEQLLAIIAATRPPADPLAPRASVLPLPSKASAPTSAAPADRDWARDLLRRRGEYVACLANLVKILMHERAWQGVIAFDAFAMRSVKRRPLPGVESDQVGEWTDQDTGRTIIWLTNTYGLTPSSELVDQAIELVAHTNEFHPVREYLQGLTWDGTPRLEDWLHDYLGVPKNEYSIRVGKRFLLGMVRRVMEPGSKFDYCLVIEGKQGRRKSSALRILGGEWFSDTELDLANKDAMSAIRGKWLHEFPEMGSIARAEANRQKSFLTRQVDEFRPVFARREIRCPRQLVFAGSTNDDLWQKDPTGARRFWPVEVSDEIDTEGLSAARDQLFAEALQCYRRGDQVFVTPDEQAKYFDPVQIKREAEDAFFDLVHDWLEVRTVPEFTLADVLGEALKLDAGRMTRDVMTRVGIILKKMGCKRHERRNGVVRFVYELPDWTKYAKARAAVESRDGPMPF